MNRKKLLISIFSLIVIVFLIFILYLKNKKDVTYLVSFETNGGTMIDTQTVKKGEKVRKPNDPTKDGYTFIRWVYEGNTYDFNLEVTKDFTLTADWQKEEEITEKFTVKFDSDGGSIVPSQIIEKGNNVIKPENPTKDGYIFKDWVLENDVYDFNKAVDKDLELKALWEKEENNYIVSFNSNGGSVIASQTVKIGGKVSKPSNPTRAGYTFKEWQLNGKTYNFNNVVNGNITLTAIWNQNANNNYTVTFNSNGGSAVASQTVKSGGKVSKPSNPTRAGYTFKEWQLNGKTYNFNNVVNGNITLTAIWTQNQGVTTYTVTFNSTYGSTVASQTVKSGGKATRPSNPTREGYKFKEWELNGKAYNFDSPVTSNITLFARWDFNFDCTVSFNSNGGSAVPSQTVKYGEKATRPSNPTRDGYSFVEWNEGGGLGTYNFDSPVTRNMTLYALWRKEKFTVTFNSNGGSAVPSQTVKRNGMVSKPSNPTREGYKFIEWQYEKGKAYNFNYRITQDLTLDALWEPLDKDLITFRFNNLDDISYTVNNPSLVNITDALVDEHCLTGGRLCHDIKYTIKPLNPGEVKINVKADVNAIHGTTMNMLDLDIIFTIKNNLRVDTVHVNINKSKFDFYGLEGVCKRSNSDIFNRIYSCEIPEPIITY